MSGSPVSAHATEASGGLAIEGHSIDYIPENERHAKLSSQGLSGSRAISTSSPSP